MGGTRVVYAAARTGDFIGLELTYSAITRRFVARLSAAANDEGVTFMEQESIDAIRAFANMNDRVVKKKVGVIKVLDENVSDGQLRILCSMTTAGLIVRWIEDGMVKRTARTPNSLIFAASAKKKINTTLVSQLVSY